MEIDAKKFWARFDELKQEKGLTILKICELDPSLVYKTITQQRTREILPNIGALVSIAEVFNVTVDFLVTGKDSDNPVLSMLKENKTVYDLTFRLSSCSAEKLHCVNSLLDTWGIDRVPGESQRLGRVLA